ncbi:MAG TPA: DNA translocase FtsK, partial [Anaerolineales bacterium]|nr:DNA translocase FtsK [Anaerolineales bacterium]
SQQAPRASDNLLQGSMEAGNGGAEAGSVQPVKQKEARKNSEIPPEYRKKFKVEPAKAPRSAPPPRDERLPALDLLEQEKNTRPDERTINQAAGMIEKTLAEFGLPVKVIGIQVGPTVTQFAVEPGYVDRTGTEEEGARQKVRVSQISALSRDLALALSADRIRVEAPVPGRPYVGIEIPNPRSSIVRLRPILESEEFFKSNSPLALALGRNVSGEPVVADLASMPHLLIAGATGTGKSICISAITTCLVMNNSPEDLRLVMVDPKMVEMVRFNGLPHLFGKVETELQRMLAVLRWTVAEMDRRYKLMEKAHARDIDAYNTKMRRTDAGEVLPRVVTLIDELADLMMISSEQTEASLVRLAQMGRATGIHLVLATQRPSTDVVTGLIKANFPARISFAVASSIDSRVILDVHGAESLLGRGDMLYLPPEAGGPVRVQGVMISDKEVDRVIDYWRTSWQAGEEGEVPWENFSFDDGEEEDEALIEEAAAIVRQSGRASASMLQRRLRIGYPRAARLIDQLEELGVVGPSMGPGKEREILLEDEVEDE